MVRPDGTLLTRGPGAYKIPSLGDIPSVFNVALLRHSHNPSAVFSSKVRSGCCRRTVVVVVVVVVGVMTWKAIVVLLQLVAAHDGHRLPFKIHLIVIGCHSKYISL